MCLKLNEFEEAVAHYEVLASEPALTKELAARVLPKLETARAADVPVPNGELLRAEPHCFDVERTAFGLLVAAARPSSCRPC